MDVLNRWAFMAPAAILLLAVLAYPIVYTVEISFAELDLGTFTASAWVGWDNYRNVLENERFWHSLKVTGVYLAWAMPIQMVLGFGIAFLINAEWRGRSAVRALFLIFL
ncbi:MAG: sugar ABC transporter permease, partial [Rhodoferax sp.]|nr:sugar ABC transporter permease [Rhodoferax sp.]